MNLNILFRVVFWRGLTAVLSFLTMFYCMRNMSVYDFSDYSFAFTVYTAFSLLPGMGINNQVALDNGNIKLIEKNNNVKIYFSLFILVIIGAYSFALIQSLIFFAMIGGIASSIFDSYLVSLQAKKEFIKYSLFMPVKTAIILIVVVLTAYFLKKADVQFIFRNIAIIFMFFYVIFVLFKINSHTLDFKNNLSIYRDGFSFLVFDLCAMLMMRAEVWILSFYNSFINLPKENIANYWAAFNFIMIVSIMGSTLANLILPYIKESAENNFSKLNVLIRKVIMIMFLLLIVSVFASYIASKYYLSSSYNFLPYYVLSLGVGVFFAFLANIERLKLMGYGVKGVDRIVINQFLISIVCNFIFIYLFGIWGAVLTFIIVRLYSYLSFSKKVKVLV